MANPDILGASGKKVVLLGNEAIVRGALESGLGFSAAYPGTPSTEVGMSLADFAKKLGIYFEWSTNEKLAFEACVGASFCGVNSITSMKHFGFNVASDSVFPVVYTGVRGALVIVVADDPGGLSSAQSEQDTRLHARLGNIPVLEPSNAQECRDFAKIAFEISKKYEIPVIIRTTTRTSHAVGTVKLGKIKKGITSGEFRKDYGRYYNIAPALQKLHGKVLEKLAGIEREYSKINKIEGNGKTGIITSGICYEYVKEMGLKNVKIAKLNLSNPIAPEFIKKFAKGLKKIIVVEELEPVIEQFVNQVLFDEKIKIYGKSLFPRYGEFSAELVAEKIAPLAGIKRQDFKKHDALLGKLKIPIRRPVLCQGCPHRSTFYAAQKVFGNSAIWAGDIGCYTLGVYEPYFTDDFVLSMGSGTGIAHGIKKVSNQRVVSFIGDSTFFHAGMPAIANLSYNKSNPVVVILDNSITAMTGQQPCANSGINALGEGAKTIQIEDVVKALGISNIKIANSYSQKDMQEAFKQASEQKEAVVVISRGICRLLLKRQLHRKGKGFAKYSIDQEKCIKCRICSDKYACPAIIRKKNYIWIERELCWGCGVCPQVCPVNAISLEAKK
ncbi:MAG: indolepyruvate ferredoxin oxidoreductase subunit alpha [Candidatus Diapherotrites archaeon]|nr:indolepyruvate ferredoxin oxidoreductase subunit alpha [Candidatus Diapherotrites archaeon]